MTESTAPQQFEYSPWRHGGWYVDNVRYPSGAVGCVTNKMCPPGSDKSDRKWRIACDERAGDHTYKTRDEAALAEWHLAQAAKDREPTGRELTGVRYGLGNGKVHLTNRPLYAPGVIGRSTDYEATYCGRDSEGCSHVFMSLDVMREVGWDNEQHICKRCLSELSPFQRTLFGL